MSYERFRFGAFTIDTACITLQSGDALIAVRPKSYALLEYLVRNPGRLLGKDELLAAVWPGVVEAASVGGPAPPRSTTR